MTSSRCDDLVNSQTVWLKGGGEGRGRGESWDLLSWHEGLAGWELVGLRTINSNVFNLLPCPDILSGGFRKRLLIPLSYSLFSRTFRIPIGWGDLKKECLLDHSWLHDPLRPRDPFLFLHNCIILSSFHKLKDLLSGRCFWSDYVLLRWWWLLVTT